MIYPKKQQGIKNNTFLRSGKYMFLISECNLFLSSQFEYSVLNLDSQRNTLYLVNFIHHLPSFFLIQVEGNLGLKKFFWLYFVIVSIATLSITITDINPRVFEINHLLPQRKGVYKCHSLVFPVHFINPIYTLSLYVYIFRRV